MKSIEAKLGGRKEEGNSYALMAGGKCLYMKSRTRPYYLRRCKRAGPRPADIDSLHDELISYILLRLPAHHLHDCARFVCREGGGHPILMTATQGQIAVAKLNYICRSILLTSSNGLAAELDWSRITHNGSISIMNPATKQSFLLPSLLGFADYTKCSIGFAMPSSKYKLTMPHYNYDSQPVSLAILTFGVDKSWRNVENVPQNFRNFLRELPLSTEGLMHWVRPGSSYVLTMDVETDFFRVMVSPYPLGAWRPLYHLSTGKFLSVLIACGAFWWEIWVMESETGEWRKVVADIKLEGGAKMWLQKFASSGKDGEQVLEPFGWVKYLEVLAFCYSGESGTCIFYNLGTHQISVAELPLRCSSYLALVHKNSLVRL